ncbi:MAG: hypothetical protein N2320_02900 [Candidatus Bipolaricaulota bacterium]|nr:hypothetical protein [Candidatus Bipolaricaulota bacterium]
MGSKLRVDVMGSLQGVGIEPSSSARVVATKEVKPASVQVPRTACSK